MSLPRPCQAVLRRPNIFTLPLRPSCALHTRRTYASQRTTESSTPPSNNDSQKEPSSSSQVSAPAQKDASKPEKPKKLKADAFLAKVQQTMANREAVLNPRPSGAQTSEGIGRGNIAPGSIFDDVLRPAERKDRPEPSKDGTMGPTSRNVEAIQSFLNPHPHVTQRWLRKMVARRVKRRGRLTTDEVKKRTERELRVTSDFWKTSIKKIAPLARLIAGKSVEEALVQLRFSKKMVARKIYTFLLESRNRAIVERGMNLGGSPEDATNIRLKNGKSHDIDNPTDIYIAQAWVGQGSYGRSPEYRARGKVNMLRHPTTSISFLLKEEKTRIREHNEREEHQATKKPWLQMPNRPITAQRPYYSW